MPGCPEDIREREWSKFRVASDGGCAIGVSIIDDLSDVTSAPASPTIYNLSMPLAATEYSQALTNNTKKITIKVRGGGTLRVAFASGDTNVNYLTIPPGASYSESDLNLVGKTVYLQCNSAGRVAEILEWT